MLDAAPVGIGLADADGRVLEANARMLQIFGLTLEEFRALEEGVVGEQNTYKIVSPLFNGAEDVIYLESWQRRQDGARRQLAWWCRVLKEDDGTVTGALSTARDITEQRAAEEALQRLNEELEERVAHRTSELEISNRELESFAYSISHDLRAPLRAINGYSAALLEDNQDRLDEASQEHLCRLRRASMRMGQLIDVLLRLARVTRDEIVARPVDLSSLAHRIASDLQAEAPGRRVTFSIAPDLHSLGDPRLLRLALYNLLHNAWKFTSMREQAAIEFGGSRNEGKTVFRVHDNGVGFDMDYAGKLFGPFQRLHRADEFPGTGVGLATVQRVVERHGGRVWVEAVPDQGVTVYFTLPTP